MLTAPGDVAICVLGLLARVEHGHLTFRGGGRESGEIGHVVGPRLSVTDERMNFPPDSGSGGTVDTDTSQLAGGVSDLVGCFTDQCQRHTPPLIEPPEVGDERSGQLEAKGSIEVTGCEGGARSQIDNPLACVDTPA